MWPSLFAGAALLAATTGPAGAYTGMEAAVLAEINFARTQPQAYAETLRGGRERDWRHADRDSFEVGRGGAALDEAIRFLGGQRPLPPLSASRGLAHAAASLAEDQAEGGGVGHASGLRERIQAQGVWAGVVAETISYGQDTAAAVVRQLIVDDGVPGRGHRAAIFDPSLSEAGAGCGRHRTYGHMCVIDFAGAVVAR
jgi:uncharacterized protein YkwD